MATQTKKTEEIISKEKQYVLGTYTRPDFVLTHGEGITVTDSEGKTYLDFGSGIAVTALGHSDSEVTAAIGEQAGMLSHVSNLYHTAPQAELAEALCQKSFADKVFYCNSGAEANEAAIKFARKYARTIHGEGKTNFVVFDGAFHGRTMGSLALTPREKYQKSFTPLMPDVTLAPFNDVDAIAETVTEETCAVFVEPIQGEGGVKVATKEFLQALRTRCDAVGALLVFDEIQCGLGRTGKLWAHEHFDVTPDMMTLAKSLANGLPMGATLLTDRVAETVAPGDHASTFAAGAIASRVAQIVVDRVSDPDMLNHINSMGELIIAGLNDLDTDQIVEIRGKGLMIGVEMKGEVGPILEAGYKEGILLLSAGPHVLRLLPAYITTEADIENLMTILRRIIR